jgi:hypothetical protein
MATQRNAGEMFFVSDENKSIHAVAFIVWDKHSAYYLAGGADPCLRSSGAQNLVLWEAIRFASTVTQKFDFEGSMIERVEASFRNFGAKQKPYFLVQKDNRSIVKKAIRNILNAVRLLPAKVISG